MPIVAGARRSALWLLLASLVLVLAGVGGCRKTSESHTSAAPPPAPAPSPAPAPVQSAAPVAAEIPSSGRAVAAALSEAFEAAAARVGPSVVPIFAESVRKVKNPLALPSSPFEQLFGPGFFQHFMGAPGQAYQTIHSLGSGVIVDANGTILTNNHVVDGAERLTVVLPNHERYRATVVGTDPLSDLAVIRIHAPDLQAATLGDSSSVKVGEWVIAVGNPFQLLHTVTSGIISAKGRSSLGLAAYEDFIQTDAAINPGNSGGALADLDGNVIAINTAIQTPSGGNVGIGLAIPINMAKWVMSQLIAHGKVVRGFLGVTVQDLNEGLAKALGVGTTQGALVGDVIADGPAAKGGLERGDVIVSFEGHEIGGSRDLRDLTAQTKPDTEVKVDVLRNGKRKELHVTLGEQPQPQERKSEAPTAPPPATGGPVGLQIQTLTPDVARELGEPGLRGVLVASVTDGSPAAQAGLRPGDVVEQADGKPVTRASELESVLKGAGSGETVALLVARKGTSFFVPLRMP